MKTLQTLYGQLQKSPAFQKQQQKDAILTFLRKNYPHNANTQIDCQIKGKTLFIKTDSLPLLHTLRLNKKSLVKKINEALRVVQPQSAPLVQIFCSSYR